MYKDIVSLMAASGENLQTLCCAVRKNNFNYLDIALEDLTLDNLMVFRDHCLKISTVYLETSAENCKNEELESLKKMAYLADAEKILLIPFSGDTLSFKSKMFQQIASPDETLTGLQEKFAGCDAETAKKFIKNCNSK